MQAHLFADPLLLKDAMDREVKSVESEFQGCYSSDDSRIWQVLSSETARKDCVMNTFSWGNNQSLKADADTLWNDLKEFYLT